MKYLGLNSIETDAKSLNRIANILPISNLYRLEHLIIKDSNLNCILSTNIIHLHNLKHIDYSDYVVLRKNYTDCNSTELPVVPALISNFKKYSYAVIYYGNADKHFEYMPADIYLMTVYGER